MPAPANANGTVIQNTQRQPSAASSTPPTTGPMLTPTAWAAAKIPIARPCLPGPAALTRMAMLLAPSIAPAAPSSARNAINWTRSEAIPHKAEASVNSENPVKNISFRPAIVASRANTGRIEVKASWWAIATQLTSLKRARNSCSSVGNISWTMLASSWPLNVAMQVVPTTTHG